MTLRTIHIGASFAIVLVAYWVYALLAVPWIEPPPRPVIANKESDPLTPGPESYELAPLFPPKSWQLTDAKTINTDKAMLLWREYHNHGNGWVDLNPLTIIFTPDQTVTDPVERIRHAVVMEVPDGANLHFDRPLDLNQGGIGRLIEGRLRGPVLIRSQGKQPDHQDDLFVRTHDVDLSEQRITTASDVEFWLGHNSGRGRQMEIKLLPRLGPQAANQEGPNIGGIEQFQLEHVERLHLDMGASSPPAAQAGGAKPEPPHGPMMGSINSHPAPVEITCRGPFRFHLIDQVATFRDQVDVLRIQPNGPSDHMSCELLSIFFERPPQPPKGQLAKTSAPGFDLQPARIEARGTPTVLTAPMDHVQARAERLEYNLKTGQISLQDTQEVTLEKDRNEIHAPSLRYTPGPPDRPGQFQLLASGPGWLRGEMADRPGQQIEARWSEKLEARPQDKNEVISLHGGATLNFQAMGRLDAQAIHFWLHESPPDAAGKSSFQPDRLLAEGNVVGTSPQFSSKVQRLEVWFSNPPPLLAAGSALVVAGQSYLPSTAQGPQAGPGGAAPAAGPLSLGGQNPAAAGRQSHMEISGRLLQALVVMHDQQHGELTEVTVEDNVKLQETQTAQPGELPLLVTGQKLHATGANSPQSKVTVTGEPAHMEGRGMSLTGPNIYIDRGANVLTMEGPGQMEKFLDRDLENRPLPRGGTLRINWQKFMHFDGRTAHFQDSVNAVGESKLLQTGSMDVTFQRPVLFSEARQQQPPPLVEWMRCGDGVFVENRGIDPHTGQQTSYDRMQLKNFELNNISGDFQGNGPGWMVSVRRGGNEGFSMPGDSVAGPPPAVTTTVGFGPPLSRAHDPNQLTCTHLRFMRSLNGNKIRKEVFFHGQVRVANAPAPTWTTTLNSDDPKRLGPQAMVLLCDTMELDDMTPLSGSSSRNLELKALDNVRAESINLKGTHFTARCARLTYAQAKDMLILEGDGRSDAEIFQQEGGEGSYVSRSAAQHVQVFRKTNQVIADGVRTLDMPMAAKPKAK